MSLLKRIREKKLSEAARIEYDLGSGKTTFLIISPTAMEYEEMLQRSADYAIGKMALEQEEKLKKMPPDEKTLESFKKVQGSNAGEIYKEDPVSQWELLYRYHFMDFLGRTTLVKFLRDENGGDLCAVDDSDAPDEILANKEELSRWRAREYKKNEAELMDLVMRHPALIGLVSEAMQKKTPSKKKQRSASVAKLKKNGK